MSAKPEATAHKGTYDCHCHCGAVQYQVTLSPPIYAPESDPEAERWKVTRCSCSVCHRNGYLLVHPKIDDVHFTKGKDNLGEYYFATKRKPHWFCKNCGSSIGIGDMHNEKGPRICAMNARAHPTLATAPALTSSQVRMFRDVDLSTVQYREWDGYKNMNPPYQFDQGIN